MKHVAAMGVVVLGLVTASKVDAKGLVTDKLVAQLEPLRALAPAARETQVCANSEAILVIANAISDRKAPANVPLDPPTWSRLVGDVSTDLESINNLCKTASHSRKSIDGTMLTVPATLDRMFESLSTLIDAAKPRKLSPPLASLRKGVDGLRWTSKRFCTQATAIVKGLDGIATPVGADPVLWERELSATQKTAIGVQGSACAKRKAVPEEVGGLQAELAAAFYRLVLLVPSVG